MKFPDADQSKHDIPRWRSALNSRDRMMLVHESSNFHLLRPDDRRYEPPSVEVDRLMLSSLGGWLASSFETEPPAGNTTIQEWVHRAALGRDSYVKVVYAGFLLPFLQPASLVKVTERKIDRGVAYLFQRMYVVVRDPVRSYGATPEQHVEIDRAMPFSSVRILTPATPALDGPKDLSTGALNVPGMMFTPRVGGADFRFRMVGVDLVGRLIEFDGPLVFAEYDHNASQTAVDKMIKAYNTAVPVFDLRGQKVAFAPSATADDTSEATRTMTFNVVTTPKILEPTPGSGPARADPAGRHRRDTGDERAGRRERQCHRPVSRRVPREAVRRQCRRDLPGTGHQVADELHHPVRPIGRVRRSVARGHRPVPDPRSGRWASGRATLRAVRPSTSSSSSR